MNQEIKKILRLIAAISIPLSVGFLTGITKTSADMAWYAQLNLPSFVPPTWLFKRVWTYLYILMGIALYLIWIQKPSQKRTLALILFGIQLFLNAMWSIVFFKFHSPAAAMIEMLVLCAFIALTIHAFFRVSKVVGWLLVPYAGWVLFALLLNVFIYRMNV